jgi:hypothetical protein
VQRLPFTDRRRAGRGPVKGRPTRGGVPFVAMSGLLVGALLGERAGRPLAAGGRTAPLQPGPERAGLYLPWVAPSAPGLHGPQLVEVDPPAVDGATWQAVAVAGRIGYAGRVTAAGRAQLVALDLATPGPPGRLGQPLALPDRPLRIAQGGGFLVVTSPSAIVVVDGRDPGRLQVLGQLPANGALGVALSGRFAYVRDGGRNFVTCADLEGRAVLPPTPMPFEGTAPAAWLRILDLASPEQPHVVGELAIRLDRAPCLADLAVRGRHVYLAAQSAGLEVVDVLDPAAPRRLGRATPNDDVDAVALDAASDTRLWTDDGLPGAPYVRDLAISGWDGADPMGLVRLAPLRLSPTTEAGRRFLRLVATPAGLLAADRHRLWWLATTDPRQPRQRDTWPLGPEPIHDLAADGRHALVARGKDGLSVFAIIR